MLKTIVIHGFPFAADVIVSLVLFVGRHALASAGYDERTVGSVVGFYGVGYVIASLAMTRLVKPRIAKGQMLTSLAGIIVMAILLANVRSLRVTQGLYVLFPFAASLFFNSFQIFMLGVSNAESRPLAVTAGHFTMSWSLGFALGPFISSLLKNTLPWSAVYYAAAAVAALMGVALLRYRPAPQPTLSPDHSPASAAAPRAEADYGPPEAQQGNSVVLPRAEADCGPPGALAGDAGREPVRSLIGPIWVGLLVGWTVWNVALIYWPVQAVALGIPTHLRSLVEFTAAFTQGLGALALTLLPGWHRKPGWLAAFGALAAVSLALFSTAAGPVVFGLAALLYGAFTASMFSGLVYHGMVEEKKAVHRIALGETIVGVCFLISSPVATLLHREGTPFAGSYLALAALLAAGIAVQVLYARALTQRAGTGFGQPN